MQSVQATTRQKEGVTAWKKKIIIAYTSSTSHQYIRLGGIYVAEYVDTRSGN